MVLVQNKYKNTLVGVLRTQITFVRQSSSSCYVTLRTQVIRLNLGNLGPQKTDLGVFIILSQDQHFLTYISSSNRPGLCESYTSSNWSSKVRTSCFKDLILIYSLTADIRDVCFIP